MTPFTIEDGDIRLCIAKVPIGTRDRINIWLEKRVWAKNEENGVWQDYGTFLTNLQIFDGDLQPILDLFARARDLMVLR